MSSERRLWFSVPVYEEEQTSRLGLYEVTNQTQAVQSAAVILKGGGKGKQ